MLKTAGVASPDKIIGIVEAVMWDELRGEFSKQLLDDSWAFDHDDLMELFDRAVRHMKGKS